MDKKTIFIIYIIIFIVCIITICSLIHTINIKDEQIQNYQIELNDKEWELYINQMAYDEYRELFYSCIYPDGMPNYEED